MLFKKPYRNYKNLNQLFSKRAYNLNKKRMIKYYYIEDEIPAKKKT